MQWQFGNITQVSDPIQGTISYTRNLRGDVTADEKGTYQLDLLGRPQSLTYYGGAGIETWTYTPDQKVASHTQNGGTDTYTYDAVGNLTSKNMDRLQETWSFQYGPQGIEGATCITPSGTITQNYCTDPSGTPLAMYYTDQRGGIGQTFTGMLYFHYDNFGNTAMLTDASGVPQVLYQYDVRTSLFTSINANNIRNPFTSLGEEGAITDSLTLTTNVDWTVYRGGVNIDTNFISMLETYKKCVIC
jgi:YD repeat-containing protein